MKTNPNHKYRMLHVPSCSCGWQGRVHWLKSDCAAEWRQHREICEAKGS